MILPVLFSLGCLTGCGDDPIEEGENIIQGPGTYYDKYDLTLEGGLLEEELQKMCFETHRVYVKYSQNSNYEKTTYKKDGSLDHYSVDLETYKKGEKSKTYNEKVTSKEELQLKKGDKSKTYNEYFYTGNIATGAGTREHVWPCANSAGLWVHDDKAGSHYVDGSTYKGGGSDLYHIRPCNTTVNTARGNSKYCDFDDPEFASLDKSAIAEVGDKGPYTLKIQGLEGGAYGDKSEPADAYKGDIARILVYIWIHYSLRSNDYKHKDMLARLDLTNVMGYGNDSERVREKLCEWNEMDPPSETEKLRNNTVQGIQGNRNMFVDHPELMNQLFGY